MGCYNYPPYKKSHPEIEVMKESRGNWIVESLHVLMLLHLHNDLSIEPYRIE
jgi:hypothetical protein